MASRRQASEELYSSCVIYPYLKLTCPHAVTGQTRVIEFGGNNNVNVVIAKRTY
jgi:hypothetical protein